MKKISALYVLCILAACRLPSDKQSVKPLPEPQQQQTATSCGTITFSNIEGEIDTQAWTCFSQAVVQDLEAEITIIHVTVEGDPILYHLHHDTIFQLYVDQSKDRFSAGEHDTLYYRGLREVRDASGTDWELYDFIKSEDIASQDITDPYLLFTYPKK